MNTEEKKVSRRKMLRTAAGASAVVGLATAGAGAAGEILIPSASEFVENANRKFAAAVESRSAAGLGDLYTFTATILPPNFPLVRGNVQIENFWQQLIDVGLVELQLSTVETESRGGLAYTVGEFRLALSQPDGSVVEDKGSYLTVLVRLPGLGWRFQSDAWNTDLPLVP